jgi:parallel beta-helix repeat protein
MRTQSICKGWACSATRTCLLLFATLFLLPAVARATDVAVDCSGATPGAFTSITSALNFLPINSANEPHVITVSGTCTESVLIFNRQRITIQAAPGQTTTINATNSSVNAFSIVGSRAIVLVGLVIQQGNAGLQVAQGSEATIQNCTIQNNSSDGLLVQNNSTLTVQNSTIQQNGGNGVFDAHSQVGFATFPAQRNRILGNGGDGIQGDGSLLQVDFGTVDVENNAGPLSECSEGGC